MRPPHEIRRLILRLRDKGKLSQVTLCERARVSRHDLFSCFNMRASEDTLRKLDAFLDAPNLHKLDKRQNEIEYEIDRLSREAWREFRLPTKHPDTVAKMSMEQKKSYLQTLTWRAKFRLQRKVLSEHAIVVKVPDGATYWQYKTRTLHRIQGEEAIRTGDRDSRRVPWPRPVGEERPL